MSLYHHLTLSDRETILLGIASGQTQREIAQTVGCSRGTISRELKRNGGRAKYRATSAQTRYQRVRQPCRPQRILMDVVTRKLIVHYIVDLQWSPEQIAGRFKYEHSVLKISYNTIYRGILGEPLTSHGARGIARKLRHRGKTRKVKGTVRERRGKLNDATSIHVRPSIANNRARLGDWEGDTVRGKTGRSALVTLVDRKSRFLLSQRVSQVKSTEVSAAIITLLGELNPAKVKTLTPDRGPEFAKYQEFGKELNVKIYFPNPHAPQERGTNENTNGLLREYLPKGTDLDLLDNEAIESMIYRINNRPRKVLSWQSPREVFEGEKLHLV